MQGIKIKKLPISNYQVIWQQMRDFTLNRTPETPDEIWSLQHHPVFTQGQAGKKEHILNPGDIPIVQTDRGGQVTYHGPGQLIIYPLIDIRRRKIGVKQFVNLLEQGVINTLKEYKIEAYAREDAPGVYVDQAKICSIGLKITRGATYHGIALNIDMDLEPFSRINPCGFKNLKLTQVKSCAPNLSLTEIEDKTINNTMQLLLEYSA
ncbi:MAG: lipoyl(octanoyl) transferase LipB [Gammaproteobacteria bacterium]|nr:lipoyl(octanoyl) transferase LipB [Gammaproteobacteria bacterium]